MVSVCLAFATDIASAQITANIIRQPLQTRAGSPITSNPNSNLPVVVSLVHTGNSTAVSNAIVTATVNTGSFTGNSTTNATTDVGGNATFSNLVLTQASAGYTLTFSANVSGTTANATSSQFPIIAAAASSASLTAPPGNATYGSPLDPAATVRLTDAYGNPVSNTNITASLNGTATFLQSNTTVRTDTGGNATFSNLRPAQVGNFTLTFTTSAAGVGNVTTNVSTSPLATTITIGNATINATASFPPPGFSVSSGPTPSAVAFSQNASEILGNFTYTTNNSTALGNHSLGITPGAGGTDTNYTITYNNGTLTVTPANPFSFTPIAAPVTTEAGRPIEGVNLASPAPQSPTFRVQDEFGNPVPGITVNATLFANPNPGNATLNGTTSVQTDPSGNATFDNLIITKAGEGYVLQFSTPTLGPITTDPFNIEPGAADDITVTTQPGNATAGATIAGPPAVQVVDQYNNPVNNAYNIQATLPNGAFTGNSNTTVLTDSTGFGTFPALSTNQSGTYQIQFAALAAGNITSTSANFTVNPDFASANISVAIQPGNSTAGVAIAGPPTVRILDKFGNAVPNHPVSASPTGSGNFSANSTTSNTTDTTGNATFGNLRLETAGNYTLTLSFANATSAGNSTTTSAFTVNPASAAKLVMVTQPSPSAQAGIAFTTQPAVRLQDAFSNNVSQTGTLVTATASGTGNGTSGGTTNATTTANGTATFSGLTINGTTGNYTLAFSTGTLANATSSPVALNPGNPSQLHIATQPSATAMANATFGRQPVVQVRDAWSNTVTADNTTTVSAALNTAGLNGTLAGNTTSQAANGNATFSNLRVFNQAGNYTLVFTSGNLSNATTSNITITPDLTSANLTVAVQPGNVTAGNTIPGSPAGNLTARVLDQYQNPIGGYTVNATLNSASFTSNSTRSATTGGDGNATFSNLVSNTAGTFTIGFVFTATTATTASNSATSSSFTVNPAAADKIVMVSQPPATSRAGVAFDNPNAPQVRLQDQFNNNVLQNGTVVTVSVGGNATLGGSTNATTDPTGTGIFPGLSIGATVGNYSLTFASGTLASATSNPVAVTPGLPNKLGIAAQPTAAAANATLSPQPSVNVLDAWNNLVTSDNGTTVSAALNPGGAGGNLAGPATTMASSGNATFPGLRITGGAGNYTLTFSSGNLSNATTSNITVTPDLTTASISITSNAANSTAGQLIQGTPAARIVDQYSNPIAGHSVNATLNTGNFTANSTTSNVTGANGTAVFANLRTNTAGNYTLRFSFSQNAASGNATTSSFTVNAAAAAALAITTQPPGSAQAGITLAQQPVVQVRDAYGNNRPESGLVIAATANGTATANGSTTATTNGSGTASFSGLRLDGTVGIYALTFANGTLNSATSNSIALGAGNAAKLAVTTQPGNSTAAGSAFNPQPAVRLQDAFSNNVTQNGTIITASVTFGNATTGGNTNASTTANGTATFNGLTIAGPVGNYTLTFNATGLANATSNPLAITANPATALISIGTNATTSVAGQTIQGPPSARIVDGSGNPLPGFMVNATINQNSGNFTGTRSATTNATGVASFGNITQTVAASGYNIRFSFSQNGSSGNATTANFSVTAAAVANMAIAIQPKSWIAGLPVPGAGTSTFPVVQLRDAFNNAISSQNVTASLAGGNFAVGSNTTVSTDSGGNATFNNLVVNTAATGYQIDFSGPNSTSARSFLFNIAANSVSKLTLTNSLQSSAPFGVPLDPQPVVQLADDYNNPVLLANYTITAAASTGNLSAGSTASTNSNGTATFSGLSLAGPLGNRTLVFSSGALENATSSTINLVAGPPANLAIAVQPATSFNAGDTLRNAAYTLGSGPVVRVLDAAGNPVASTSINANGLGFPAFGTGSNTTISADAGGNATFTNLIVVKAGGGLKVNFTTGNLSVATTGFNVEALPASTINITQQPPPVVFQNAVISPNPKVALLDLYGNPTSAPGTVSVALNGGAFASGNTTVPTISGLGMFTNLVIATIGNYTLTFNATGVAPVTSNTFSVGKAPASGLSITSITSAGSGNYTIAFSADQGGQYWIQRTTDLKNGPWTYVSTTASTAVTGNNTTTVTNPGGSKAFWRLTTQTAP